MSIEWVRNEPERDIFNEKALHYYREEIEMFLINNIQPLVTLHHFPIPYGLRIWKAEYMKH